MSTKNAPESYIRFGMQRKKELLKDIAKAYNGLVIPANILLYQYKATPMAIYMCDNKQFIVDPMSYLFGQPYEEFKRKVKEGVEFKPSFEILMKEHGLNVADFLPYTYEKLLSFIHGSEENLKIFVNNCLIFQRDTALNNFKKFTVDMLPKGQKVDEKKFLPKFLIPPYFLYQKDHVTTQINKKILKYAATIDDMGIPIYPMLFLRREDVNSDFGKNLIAESAKSSFPGFCLWIDKMPESNMTEKEARGLIDIVWTLSSKKNRPIMMMYGGFFYLLLYHFGLTGVSHGTLFSQSKGAMDAVRQSAGPAPVRYYIRDLHDFFTLEASLLLLREIDSLICNCQVCQRIVRGKAENIIGFQNEEALAEMHFLYNRWEEKLQIAGSTPKELADYLETMYTLYKDEVKQITKTYKMPWGEEERPIADLDNIKNWARALKDKATELGV